MEGDRLVNTPYEIKFKEDVENQVLCTKKLTSSDLYNIRMAIAEDYYFQVRRSGCCTASAQALAAVMSEAAGVEGRSHSSCGATALTRSTCIKHLPVTTDACCYIMSVCCQPSKCSSLCQTGLFTKAVALSVSVASSIASMVP